jgi:hypothetical protein
MAALHSFRHSTVGLFLGAAIFLVAGCQSQTSMVGDLPSPNFSGPVAAQPAAPRPPVAAAAAPKPQPAPVQPKAQPPKVASSATPRDWTPHVPARSWQAIVIHHSATPAGGAVRFDREHREKGWDELGYDFVIGNGTDTADGLTEVGSRWVKQKIGAHAKTPDNWYNEHAIGICLVGNFDGDRPTPAQMRSAAKLVAYMMKTYHIPANQVIGHGDTKPTECPGRYLHVADVRRMAAQVLVAEGEPVEQANPRTASTVELLTDLKER